MAPRKPKAPKVSDVIGPHRAGKKWELRWVENGKNRCKEGTLAEVQKFRRELTGGTQGIPPRLPRRAKFGSAAYFKKCLADALEANRVACVNLDHEAIKATRSRVASIREASVAAAPFLEHEQVQEAFEKVLDYLEKHGHMVKVEGVQDLQPASPELAEALSGVAGPWETAGGHGPAVPDQGRGTRGDSN